jgi:hypothetical protein
LASPLFCELSVAKRRQLNFCSMQARAFLRFKQNMVLSPDWELETRHRGGLPAASGMSALGQKKTFAVQKGMSVFPLKADMCSALGDVR